MGIFKNITGKKGESTEQADAHKYIKKHSLTLRIFDGLPDGKMYDKVTISRDINGDVQINNPKTDPRVNSVVYTLNYFCWQSGGMHEETLVNRKEKTKTKTKGGHGVARAIAGSVFGPAGAVVGAVTAQPKKTETKVVRPAKKINIPVENPTNGYFILDPKNGTDLVILKTYPITQHQANHMSKILNVKISPVFDWIEDDPNRIHSVDEKVTKLPNSDDIKAPKKPKPISSLDEQLRTLKGLLDDNIITQEEFDAKKKQILKL
ncbi:SHOCT domain-containing protein [Lacticaseibacillus parahuelsenbergensis]|uniref:SHOCT domain-containing protein n=1 Tax=Lacticaseibacillus parahuelsenbergensis TaxID=3068305 RepID=A0ABY9L5L0_9LACO|nr:MULTISPECIES: SHOCT domain-containing protein [Lacticaseibacillus]MDE3282132.1 SHOCT domain-containing protein [Lacticaseibacillus casei]WLV79024.1 SHOCT domain-containing protein [Lacticaseibacillus sp. NCIMB 15471]